ncbi:NAD(P)H-dependent oxidoreductase [Clostridium oceanicum]|uniref:NAD(P)H-dependent oxidoreductase n=1 Tax=Clostridium oceanicum TaxID=1543 RepID=A0ABP3UX07_9CLOT
MKVLVLNGSPKGKYSVTLQSVLYIKKHFKDDEFEILNIGQQIRKYEQKGECDKVIEKIKKSDLVLFSYPVYTFIAPSQLHRFVEVLKERLDHNEIAGKFMTQLTTSKHFYDVTAHKYIEDNSHDMGLGVIKGLSADMDDLLSPEGRTDLMNFWKYVKFSVKNNCFDSREATKTYERIIYKAPSCDSKKSEEYDTVIVTNCEDRDENLKNMIEGFKKYYPYKTREINILDFKFAGGCLGCFNCASDGKCIYKDGFDSFLREKIQSADAIIYAASIKDHSLGASFKRYDDRQFCNGHRAVTMGMPAGYILSGDYSKESNLKTIVEGRCEVGHNFLTGVATDEIQTKEGISENLNKLAKTTSYALENKLVMPQNFLGVGGTKIFRDLIYLMRGLMKEDHRFYKKHGIYDFPQKKIGTRLKIDLLGMLMSIPAVKKNAKGKMNEAMIKPYKKALLKD